MKSWHGSFRIWHWLFAFTFIFMALTVAARETFLDKSLVSSIIIEDLSINDITLSKEDAIDIAKDIRRSLWKWHIYIGYLFAGLVAARYLLFFTSSGRQNYIHCSEKTLHKKGAAAVYLLIYASATILALTGLGMKFGEGLGFSEDFSHTLEEIHEIAFYGMLALVTAHIVGVVIAENSDEKGIVSNMIGKQEE